MSTYGSRLTPLPGAAARPAGRSACGYPCAPAKAAAAAPAPAAGAAGTAPPKAEQTGITFLDPASLVLDTAEFPVDFCGGCGRRAAGSRSAAAERADAGRPGRRRNADRAAPAAGSKGPPVVAAAVPAAAPVIPDSARTEARVPIARTGSLSSAATKLAAASRRTSEPSAPRQPRPLYARSPPRHPGCARHARPGAGSCRLDQCPRGYAPPSPKPKARPPLPRRRRSRRPGRPRGQARGTCAPGGRAAAKPAAAPPAARLQPRSPPRRRWTRTSLPATRSSSATCPVGCRSRARPSSSSTAASIRNCWMRSACPSA